MILNKDLNVRKIKYYILLNMPVKYKVKFDDDGNVCRNDIDYLRKHPECGFPTKLSFNPINPTPIHKFKQINRDFDMKNLDKLVPRVPSEPVPRISPDTIISGDPTARMLGDPLAQDYTNILVMGRRLIPNDYRTDGYDLVRQTSYETTFRPTGYSHQDYIPSFEEYDPIGVRGERYEVGGDVPLEDFGAGTGINLSTNFEALPRGDPRTAEEFAPTLSDLPEDILNEIQNFARRPTDILDLPQNIRQKIIQINDEDIVPEEVPIDMEEINLEIQRLGRLLPVYDRAYRTGGSEEIRESAAGSINRVTNQIESLTNLQQRLQNFINVRRGAEEALEIGRPPRQRGIQEPKIPRPRGVNQQEIELQELQNLTRNETPREAERIRRVMFRDVPEDAKVRVGKGKQPPRIPKKIKIVIINANDLPGELARELINQGFANSETGEINLNDIRDKIINLQNDVNILSGEPRENVERQIVELQDLLKEANKFVQPELIQERLPPPEPPPSPPEETQMFPIEEIDEYTVALEEVNKLIKPNQTELTEAQKEIIVKNMEKRGVTRQRTLEMLSEAELIDPAMERAVGGRTRTKAEALARAIRGGLQHSDTNLRPETFELEITPETPMLSREPGRGRSRIQKQIQKRAGQLPEELRGIYKQAERSAGQFSENIRGKSLDAIQQIRATSQRAFGRRYSRVFPTEFDSARNVFGLQELGTDSGIISARPNITEEVTGIRAGDLASTPEPLSLEIAGTPKLTYAKTLRLAKEIGRGATSREAGLTGAGALGGIGVGYGVGYGMNLAFEKLGIHENMATATLTGGIAGGSADVGGRIISMGLAKSLQRAGVEVGAQTLASAGTGALIRGAGEGLVIGAVLTPVDILFNNALVSSGFSHTAANITSSAVVGTAATGATAIGLASLGAAPETMGASLVVGALAIGATSVIGFFTGQDQDRKQEEAKKLRDSLNTTSEERTKLIDTLKDNDYNFDDAVENYGNKPGQNREALGMGDDTWSSFSISNSFMFQQKPRPYNPPSDNTKELNDEDRKVNELFSKFVLNETIRQICNEGSCSDELKAKDPGRLTLKENSFLNDKTGKTWFNQAKLQVATQINSLKFTQVRITNAKTQMLDTWNNKQELVSQDILNVAYLDPNWKQKFDTFVKLDAQKRVVDAYQDSQTRIEQMPKTIRDLANQDPEFDTYIHHYYSDMETTAGQLNISVPQLITLQGTPLDRQGEVYEGMQFDNMKQNPEVVADAQEIVTEEDAVRKAEFYDIDQAYLESDPTNLTTWIPSDAQILQAYNAGMTLREYTDYMHELAKGEDGDFTRLPVYTQEQIKKFTDDDIAHFQDELKMSGHEGLYTWDSVNRTWVLHHGIQNNPNVNYISKYTPGRLLKARQEYADMIHGLNEKNQNAVDNFNNNLMKELTSYGKNYDSMVAHYNDNLLYQGRTDLLYYDIGKIYDQNKIEFKPFDDVMTSKPIKTSVSSVVDTHNRQLGEQVSIKQKYGLSDRQYSDVKRDIVSKNIKDPTMEQVETAIQEVKSSPADSPPMAS